MTWKKKNNLLSFGSPREPACLDICRQPYFVGHIEQASVEEFISLQKGIEKGKFLVRSTSGLYNKFALTIYTGNKRHKNGILEVELAFEKGLIFIKVQVAHK